MQGWDLNPRRPMPAGLEPSERDSGIDSAEEAFYHSDGLGDVQAMSGRSDGVEISAELLNEFVDWLRRQGVLEKTVRNYVGVLKRCVDVSIFNANDFFARAGYGKSSYEAFSRFLTFLSKAKGLEDAVAKIRKTMPRKPRSKPDTRVPNDEEIMKLRSAVEASGNPVLVLIYW